MHGKLVKFGLFVKIIHLSYHLSIKAFTMHLPGELKKNYCRVYGDLISASMDTIRSQEGY